MKVWVHLLEARVDVPNSIHSYIRVCCEEHYDIKESRQVGHIGHAVTQVCPSRIDHVGVYSMPSSSTCLITTPAFLNLQQEVEDSLVCP
jgi:hypothetical protein